MMWRIYRKMFSVTYRHFDVSVYNA